MSMQKVEAQSLGFHMVALFLLVLGAIMAVQKTHEPDILMVKVDGAMVESRVVARGAACRTPAGDLQMNEPLPVRNSSYPD